MADPLARDDERSGFSLSPRLIAGMVLGAALALLIAQNTRSTKVKWLTFETEQPLWLLLLITAVVTLIVAELVGGARRRRKRKGR